jgi:hypothetical protein
MTNQKDFILLDDDNEVVVHIKRDDDFKFIVLNQEDEEDEIHSIILTYNQAKDLCNAIHVLLKETQNVVSSSDD